MNYFDKLSKKINKLKEQDQNKIVDDCKKNIINIINIGLNHQEIEGKTNSILLLELCNLDFEKMFVDMFVKKFKKNYKIDEMIRSWNITREILKDAITISLSKISKEYYKNLINKQLDKKKLTYKHPNTNQDVESDFFECDFYPDHFGAPEILAWGIKIWLFSQNELGKIKFDHNENIDNFVNTYYKENMVDKIIDDIINLKYYHKTVQ